MATDLNNPRQFYELSPSRQQLLVDWVANNFKHAKRFDLINDSYNLKHQFENSDDGFYITNGVLKGAMIKAGFKCKNKSQLNWQFKIKK